MKCSIESVVRDAVLTNRVRPYVHGPSVFFLSSLLTSFSEREAKAVFYATKSSLLVVCKHRVNTASFVSIQRTALHADCAHNAGLQYVKPCCEVKAQEDGYVGLNPSKMVCKQPTTTTTTTSTEEPCDSEALVFKGCTRNAKNNPTDDCIEDMCDCGDCTRNCPTCEIPEGYVASPAAVAQAAVGVLAAVFSAGLLF